MVKKPSKKSTFREDLEQLQKEQQLVKALRESLEAQQKERQLAKALRESLEAQLVEFAKQNRVLELRIQEMDRVEDDMADFLNQALLKLKQRIQGRKAEQ